MFGHDSRRDVRRDVAGVVPAGPVSDNEHAGRAVHRLSAAIGFGRIRVVNVSTVRVGSRIRRRLSTGCLGCRSPSRCRQSLSLRLRRHRSTAPLRRSNALVRVLCRCRRAFLRRCRVRAVSHDSSGWNSIVTPRSDEPATPDRRQSVSLTRGAHHRDCRQVIALERRWLRPRSDEDSLPTSPFLRTSR